MSNAKFESGMKTRREVLGYSYVVKSLNNSTEFRFIRMKRTFVKLKRTIRQRASLPDATLRRHLRYTMANRQAVPGLLSGADVLSARLRALCGIPSGLREASPRDALRLPRYR